MTDISIGIYEAKTKFSKLIEDVNKGVQITITQRGRPVAMLVPFKEEEELDKNRKKGIRNIRLFRERQKPLEKNTFEQILKADQK